jgi:dynein assembly factor 1
MINDELVIDQILTKMPNLTVLYLYGNPICRKIPNYRKTLINKLVNLKYLDDKPVFNNERKLAEAFILGGVQKEQE